MATLADTKHALSRMYDGWEKQFVGLRRNPTTYPKDQLSERSGFWLGWGGEGTRLDEGSWMAWI